MVSPPMNQTDLRLTRLLALRVYTSQANTILQYHRDIFIECMAISAAIEQACSTFDEQPTTDLSQWIEHFIRLS